MDDAPVFSHHGINENDPDSSSTSGREDSGTAGAPVSVSDGRLNVRSVIVDLIATEGIELAEDPRRVEAFLRDLCGEFPAEITVAVSALTAGIADECRSITTTQSAPAALSLTRLSGKLHRELGIDTNLALWVVGTWALALGAVKPATIAAFEEHNKARLMDATQPVAPSAPVGLDPATAEDALPPDSQHQEQRTLPTASFIGFLKRRIDTAISRIPGGRLVRSRTARALAFVVIATSVAYFTHSATGTTGGGNLTGSPFGSPSAGGSFRIPTLGTYRYTTEIATEKKSSGIGRNSSQGTEPQQHTASTHLSISSIRIEQVGTQISAAWTGFGSTLVESDLYDWGTGKIVETSTDYIVPSTGNAASTACLWSPPLVMYKQPLALRSSWKSNSTCTTFIGGVPYSLVLKLSAHVVGIKKISVPLGKFRTVLVNVTQVSTLSSTVGTPRTTVTTSTMAIDPTTGVPVRDVTQNNSSDQVVTAMLNGFTPLSMSTGSPPSK